MGVCLVGEITVENDEKARKGEAQFEGDYEDDAQWMECWDEVSGNPFAPNLFARRGTRRWSSSGGWACTRR